MRLFVPGLVCSLEFPAIQVEVDLTGISRSRNTRQIFLFPGIGRRFGPDRCHFHPTAHEERLIGQWWPDGFSDGLEPMSGPVAEEFAELLYAAIIAAYPDIDIRRIP